MTVYPLFSVWYNERHQAQLQIQFKEQVEQVENTAILEAKENADIYNKGLIPGTQVVESFSPDALLWAAEDYDAQLNLAGTGVMGYVEIPSIQVNLPIYHGTESETLEKGVGHLLGSSLPVGGKSTHSVLTAHSGLATQKLFSDLPQLEIGDVFYLKILDETLAYQVDAINTVLPYEISDLQISDGMDYCTLITCTPFNINTHRLLVRGTRIPYEKAEQILEDLKQQEEPTVSKWEAEYLKGLLWGLMVSMILNSFFFLLWRVRRSRDRHIHSRNKI